jgi:hypothetical protein
MVPVSVYLGDLTENSNLDPNKPGSAIQNLNDMANQLATDATKAALMEL